MITTKRLLLKPLNYEELLCYSNDRNRLNAILGLHSTSVHISPELKEAIQTTMLPALANANSNYLYATLWVVICKKENKIIGGISFTGAPDVNGEIEIGYGCDVAFRNKGYMKEAVKAMLHWAGTQPEIFSVLARSSKDNIASCKILDQNKFIIRSNAGEFINWVYQLKNSDKG